MRGITHKNSFNYLGFIDDVFSSRDIIRCRRIFYDVAGVWIRLVRLKTGFALGSNNMHRSVDAFRVMDKVRGRKAIFNNRVILGRSGIYGR